MVVAAPRAYLARSHRAAAVLEILRWRCSRRNDRIAKAVSGNMLDEACGHPRRRLHHAPALPEGPKIKGQKNHTSKRSAITASC